MDIYWVQQFWFDDMTEDAGVLQRSYITIDGFGVRNMAISTQLNVVAPGAHIHQSGGVFTGELGFAAVGIKWYDYVDERGTHHVEHDYFVPHAIIHDCVAFGVSFAYKHVWAGAMGTVLYFN